MLAFGQFLDGLPAGVLVDHGEGLGDEVVGVADRPLYLRSLLPSTGFGATRRAAKRP